MSLSLTLPPFEQSELPSLLVTDELVGGSFIADHAALERLRAQIFGSDDLALAPNANGDYEVLVEFGHVTAGAGPYQARELACSFVAFRILLAPWDEVQRALANPPAPGTFIPGLCVVVTHLFVDQPLAMIYGREIFGFPAVRAREIVHERSGNGGRARVHLEGLADPVVELKWSTPAGSRPPPPNEFWELIKANPGTANVGRIPFEQRKQMRDGLDPSRACYQTQVSGAMTVGTQPLVPAVTRRAVTLTLGSADAVGTADLAIRSVIGTADPRIVVAHSRVGYSTDRVRLGLEVSSPPQAPVVRSARGGPALRQLRGDPQAAPAYTFDGVEIVGFRLPVQLERLQALCDLWLNGPFSPRSRYVPANVDLILECLHYPSMRAENPPPGLSPDDVMTQRELVFRMLVARVDEDGRTLRAPAMYCPFLFVDNTASLISGREVIGYPKLHARFIDYGERGQFDACKVVAVPPLTPRPAPVDVLTMDCRYERRPRNVERVFEPGSPPPAGPRPFERPFHLNVPWWTAPELRSGGHLDAFIEPWLNGYLYGYPGLQAKRFPDARSIAADCYREIVECDYTLLKADVSLPIHNAVLHFPDDDAFGIREAFDFARVVPVPPGSWYRTRVDFAVRVTDPLL